MGISSAVSKFTKHPFDGRKALKIMREDIDAKFSALKERLEEKKEKFVGKLETFVKVSKNGKRWSFLPFKEYIDRYKIFDMDENNVLTIRVKFELLGYVEKPLEAAAVLHQHRNLHHPGHGAEEFQRKQAVKFLMESLKGTKKQDTVADSRIV